MTVFTLHATRLDRLDLHRLIVVLFNIIINEDQLSFMTTNWFRLLENMAKRLYK